MSSQADLSGLSTYQPWAYYGSVEATALTALRALMGASYASSPTDADLKAALKRAVSAFESATGRFFVLRTGQIGLNGTGAPRISLPCSVVSADQGGDSVTSVVVGAPTDDALDADAYTVNDGAGLKPHDPRDLPFVELVSGASILVGDPAWRASTIFPRGHRNIWVTGDFGYLEADGTTPPLVQKAIALLSIRELTAGDDEDGREDAWRGSLVSEQTQGRSYTRGLHGTGAGLTLDREIDQIIAHYRSPPRAGSGPSAHRPRKRPWYSKARA